MFSVVLVDICLVSNVVLWVYLEIEHIRLEKESNLVSPYHSLHSTHIYFYVAGPPARARLSNINFPPNVPSTSTSSPLPVAGVKKRQKRNPPPPKANEVQKSDDNGNMKDANDFIGGDVNSSILEEFFNESETPHTQRRKRNAEGWQELMPSLIHPLMAALHSISKTELNEVVEVESVAPLCSCNMRSSVVKVVSFGGM